MKGLRRGIKKLTVNKKPFAFRRGAYVYDKTRSEFVRTNAWLEMDGMIRDNATDIARNIMACTLWEEIDIESVVNPLTFGFENAELNADFRMRLVKLSRGREHDNLLIEMLETMKCEAISNVYIALAAAGAVTGVKELDALIQEEAAKN